MTSQCPGPRPRLAGRAPPGPREHSQAGRGGGGARTRSGDWGRGGGAQLSSGHSSAVRSARVRRFLPGRAAPLWPGARVDPSLHLSWDSGPVEAALRREERRTVSCRLTVVSARPGDPRPGDREGLNGQTTLSWGRSGWRDVGTRGSGSPPARPQVIPGVLPSGHSLTGRVTAPPPS